MSNGVHCVDLGESFPTIALIGFDTAENEPRKVCPLFVYRSYYCYRSYPYYRYPKVVVLTCDPDAIVKRTRGRRQDPVTGESYNIHGHMPSDPEIVARLVALRSELEKTKHNYE